MFQNVESSEEWPLKNMWSPILLLAAWTACVGGHGRVFVPPSRASAWRFGFGTPADYDDDGWNCGGFAVQHAANGGKCGICGDAYNIPPPRPHELGGVYGQGVLVAGYLPGSIITTTVDLTTSHRGFWEFKLCPDPQSTDQNCFDKYVLELEEGGTKYYPTRGSTQYNVTYRLPKGLLCEHCVLQWRYTAGNNWGTCDNGTQGLGCGPQEQFGACSDIYIGTTKKHTRLVLEDAREADEQLNPWFFLNAPTGLLGRFRAPSTKRPQLHPTRNAHRQTQTTKVQQQTPTANGQRHTQTTNAIQPTLIKNPQQQSQVVNSQRQNQVTNAQRQSQTTNAVPQTQVPNAQRQTQAINPLQQTQLTNAQRQTQADNAQRQSQTANPQRLTQTTNSLQQTQLTTAQRQTQTIPQRQAQTKPTTKQHNSEPTPSSQFITQLNQLLTQSLQHQIYNSHQTNKGTETTRHTSQQPWTIKHHPYNTDPITKSHRHRPTTQRVKKPMRHAKERDKTRPFHHTTQPSWPTRHRMQKYHRPLAFSNHKAHKKSKQKLKEMRSRHGQNMPEKYSKTKKGKKVKEKESGKPRKRKKKTSKDHKASTPHYTK